MLKTIVEFLTQTPCRLCGQGPGPLCTNCVGVALIERTSSCPFCNHLEPAGKTCPKCRRRFDLAGATIIWRLEDTLKELIYEYKYNHNRSLATFFAENLPRDFTLDSYDYISFVPSDGKASRARGFDHGRLLARSVAIHWNMPLTPTLLRVRHTPQVGKNRLDRFAQVQNNFMLATSRDLVDKKILLIDDVTTTAATLNECARMLKSAGATHVWGFVLAKK